MGSDGLAGAPSIYRLPVVAYHDCCPQDPCIRNMLSNTRASRILARCHAALDEQMLAVSALDAALEGAKTGELLLSEAMAVRARAAISKSAADSGGGGSESPHWSEHIATQRLSEVAGRMKGAEGLTKGFLSL